MYIDNILLLLGLPTLLGYALLLLVFRGYQLPLLLTLSASYGVGMAVIAFWMFFLGVCQMPFELGTIALPLAGFLLVIGMILFWQRSKNERRTLMPSADAPMKEAKRDKLSHFIVITFYVLILSYLALNTCHIFWRALNMPVYTWDAISTSALRAKVFFYDRSMKELSNLPHASYPLLVPFIKTWAALCLGEWHERLVKILFPFGYISFLGITFAFLKIMTNRAWAALGIAILITSNMFLIHATISYQDFFMMYYTCSAIMFLLLWLKSGCRGFLLTASFFTGAGSFVKLEGSAYVLIIFVLFLVLDLTLKGATRREKWLNAVFFTLPSFALMLSYHAYKFFILALDLEGTETAKTAVTFELSHLERVPKIIYAFLENMFLLGSWGVAYMLLALSLVIYAFKKKSTEQNLLLLALGLFFTLYFFVALCTASYEWLAGKVRMAGLARILLHFYPLVPLFVILTSYDPFLIPLSKKKPVSFTPVDKKPNKKKHRR